MGCYQEWVGAKPGHDGVGCGKRVQRAEQGPGASESVDGDPWRASTHCSEQKGAEEREQGAVVTGATGPLEEAEEEPPVQQLGNN